MMMRTKRKMKVRMRRTTTRKWMIIWNKATKGKKRSKTNRWTNEKIQSISEGFMFWILKDDNKINS